MHACPALQRAPGVQPPLAPPPTPPPPAALCVQVSQEGMGAWLVVVLLTNEPLNQPTGLVSSLYTPTEWPASLNVMA